MTNPDPKLQRARDVAAGLVQSFGETFWPVFELLDDEVERIEARRRRLDGVSAIKLPRPKELGRSRGRGRPETGELF
jgi:hypothetical protein